MTQRDTQVLEAVFALPEALSLQRDVAGAIVPVKVGGLKLELEVPSLADGEEGERPLVVAPELQSVRKDVDWPKYLDNHWAWGVVTSWQGGQGSEGVSELVISHVLLRHEFPLEPATAAANLKTMSDKLFANIDAWSRLFMDWLEIGSKSSLSSGQNSVFQEGQGLSAWGYNGSSFETLSSSAPIRVNARFENGLSLDIWQRALKVTSSGDVPPTEYLLLRDARNNFSLGDYRRSVLDSATASEIALAKSLDMKLSSDSVAAAELVRRKWPQIAGLSEALKRFGVTLPDDIRNSGLAEPRNRAIHKGEAPTRAEAERAIQIADEVVEMATPLEEII